MEKRQRLKNRYILLHSLDCEIQGIIMMAVFFILLTRILYRLSSQAHITLLSLCVNYLQCYLRKSIIKCCLLISILIVCVTIVLITHQIIIAVTVNISATSTLT